MISKTTNRWSVMRAAGGLIFTAGLALACTDTTGTAPTYTVGGTVSGLAGSGLVLRDNDGDDLPVSANGPIIFATPVASGAAYSVTVFAQPLSPAQHCTVTAGGGTMASANVTSVAIVCATNTYTVGGTVSGLVGSGLVLRDNGGDDLLVSGNGAVTFATPVASGTAYSITVFAQPTDPAQSCAVTGGDGRVSNTNVTSVAIVCTTYTVGGTVSGLAGSGLVLRNNGDDDLPVSVNGSFTFATPVSNGAAFDVTVFAQPTSPAQTCVVTNGSGTLATANPTNVAIVCVTNAGPGAVRVTVTTTGPDAPATYTVDVDPQHSPVVPANGTVLFALAPGAHAVTLTVPQNCTVTSPNTVLVTVATGVTTNVAFSVTCVATGTLRVTVATTGPDAPATYTVEVDPHHSPVVPANGTVSFALGAGGYTVHLDVAQNCTVTSPNDVLVTVPAGAPTQIAFSVTCVALGTIQVTMTTTGTHAPATYIVKAYEPIGFGDLLHLSLTASIPRNGTVSFKLPAGGYLVRLTPPLNCTNSATNYSQIVSVASGATASVFFGVTCH